MAMGYDPFTRGPHPVGVRTEQLSRSGRPLPTEVWYPAGPVHAGEDTDPAKRDEFDVMGGMAKAWQSAVRGAAPLPGERPLVVFSHGFGGERRQSSFLCTHLASHGYRVAAPDHTGNTFMDIVQQVTSSAPPKVGQVVRDRPLDMAFVADHLGGSALGLTGHSFGGWTALTTTATLQRCRAVVPLAPAGGSSVFAGDMLRDHVKLDWGREVPSLFVVADQDSVLPIDGMQQLFARVAAPKKMVVLLGADHMHFCSRPRAAHEMMRMAPPIPQLGRAKQAMRPFDELMAAKQALAAVRGLALAHFDAFVKNDAAAREFCGNQVMSALSRKGIEVDLV